MQIYLYSTDPVVYAPDDDTTYYDLPQGVPVSAGHDSAAAAIPDGNKINWIQLHWRVKDPDGNGDGVSGGMYIAGVFYAAQTEFLDFPNWIGFDTQISVDPSTGLPWSRASIDAALMAVKAESVNPPSNPRWTFSSLLVDYSPEDAPTGAAGRSKTPAATAIVITPAGTADATAPAADAEVPDVP